MKTSSSMTRDVVIVGPQFPLSAAWQLMQERHVRHLPVVQAGRVVGILSDRDVLLRASRSADGRVTVPRDEVATAMTSAPITCSPDTRVSWVARTMAGQKIDAIPVLGASGALVGLVTSTDLLLLLTDDADGKVLPFEFRVFDAERRVAVS